MARRNKKRKRKQGFLFPVPFAGVVVMASSLALAYVWLGCRCQALGRELKALENEHAELAKQYANEMYRWARKKAPANIERALARHRIAMVWPHRSRVVRLGREDIEIEDFKPATPDDRKYAKLQRVVRHE
jgi:hypothetical protein